MGRREPCNQGDCGHHASGCKISSSSWRDMSIWFPLADSGNSSTTTWERNSVLMLGKTYSQWLYARASTTCHMLGGIDNLSYARWHRQVVDAIQHTITWRYDIENTSMMSGHVRRPSWIRHLWMPIQVQAEDRRCVVMSEMVELITSCTGGAAMAPKTGYLMWTVCLLSAVISVPWTCT